MALAALALAAGCSSAAPRAAHTAPALAPLALPAARPEPAADYRVGTGDILAVRILDLEKPDEAAALEPEVGAEGEIALPYAGAVRAAGRTTAEIRAEIVGALGRYLVDPQVAVGVKEYRSRRVVVLGAVQKPGVILLTRNRVGLVEALSLAGGLAKEAGTRAFVVAPGAATRLEFDLLPLVAQGSLAADVPIEPGSTIDVPEAQQFTVLGFVNKPGAFPYQRPTTVLEAIAGAGGLEERKASPSEVKITRAGKAGIERIEVDLDAIATGEAPNVAILPGDSIEAGRTIPRAIYCEFVEVFLNHIGGTFGLGGL
jgi:polysaccharide export outer membrane protein